MELRLEVAIKLNIYFNRVTSPITILGDVTLAIILRSNIVMCSSTIIEHKNESVAKQLCMLFPIRVSLVD